MSDLFRKHSVAVRISREMALDYGLVEPTPQEAAERTESLRVHRERVRASWRLYDAARPLLAAITHPLSRAILDLHAPETIERPQCHGSDGATEEAPMWPCRTVEAVAAHHGIALPDAWHLWRRPTDDETPAGGSEDR